MVHYFVLLNVPYHLSPINPPLSETSIPRLALSTDRLVPDIKYGPGTTHPRLTYNEHFLPTGVLLLPSFLFPSFPHRRGAACPKILHGLAKCRGFYGGKHFTALLGLLEYSGWNTEATPERGEPPAAIRDSDTSEVKVAPRRSP